MEYRDLREFIRALEAAGELKRIDTPVDPRFEVTEICDRTLRAGGPAPGSDAGYSCTGMSSTAVTPSDLR